MVQSGIVTVNNVVVLDPRVRFGGVKSSDLVENYPDMGRFSL